MSDKQDPNDGFTEDIFIRGVPGFYYDTRLKIRPCTNDETRAYLGFKGSEVEQNRVAFKLLAKHIASWDAKRYSDNKPIPLTPVGFNTMMKFEHYTRVLLVVLGVQAPDIDPLKSHAEQAEDTEDTFRGADVG